MKHTFCGILLIILTSCNSKTDDLFSMHGTTQGLENGTMVYLDNADSQNEDLIDSTIIKDNSFVFKTKLQDSPLHVVIRTKQASEFRFLWLENRPMTFNASNSDFETAVVLGSETESLAQALRMELNNLSEEDQRVREIEFIKKHPASIVSAETLSVYSTSYGKEETKALFNRLSISNRTSKYGEMISSFIQMPEQPEIGVQFQDFEMLDPEGTFRRLSDLNGKTILLDFWASWCAPCRKENPNLVRTYRKFKPQGFEIFAVSLDEDKGKWLEAIKADQLNWHHVNDLKGNGNEAKLLYGVEGIPDNFLIDSNGMIIARDLHGVELDNQLEALFYK